jgi:hypothetical protein
VKWATVCREKHELIYVKNKRDLDYSDPKKCFPFINPQFAYASMLPINDYFHDRLLPYSELSNTPQEFWDEAAGNGISKVFIGSPSESCAIREGIPVFMYRKYTGSSGSAGYKSCITSVATITKRTVIKLNGTPNMNCENFIKSCGNKTIFNEEELKQVYRKRNLVVFEFVYNGFFGKGHNVICNNLKAQGLFNTYPYDIKYSPDEFKKIIEMGGKDVKNIIGYSS